MPPAHDVRGLRRDRLVILASLMAVAALAWLYLWIEAGRMDAMPVATASWDARSLLLMFLMWSVMMVGMMLPSAAPAILLYASIARKNRAAGSSLPPAWIFTAGYLAVWTAFSVAATLLHMAFEAERLLTPMMVAANVRLTGGLLILAGIYQRLPVKDACLRKCRAPLQFLLFHWRPGGVGTFRMGAEHGLYCVGCCWALMLLLFTAGVMNLVWVAIIAGFVFIEKLLPAGPRIGRLAGVGLVATGIGIIIAYA